MKYALALLAAGSFIAAPALAQEQVEAASEAPVEAAVEAAASEVVDKAEIIVNGAKEEEARSITLPADTLVLFTMNQMLASNKVARVRGEPKPPKDKRRYTNAGDSFTMSVVNDVVVNGMTVIPAGSVGHGEVTRVSGKGGFGKSGTIEIRLNHVMIGERALAMQGEHVQKGRGRTAEVIAGTLLSGNVLGLLGGALSQGTDASMPIGQHVAFRTAEDAVFAVPNAQAQTSEEVQGSLTDLAAEQADLTV
jgi:hypothetical protein